MSPPCARTSGWVVAQGPVALALNADTGEAPHLTHAERVRVLQIGREVLDLPIVCGLAGPFTAQAVRQATDFKAAGAAALLVFPISAFLGKPLDPRVPVDTTGRSPTSACRWSCSSCNRRWAAYLRARTRWKPSCGGRRDRAQGSILRRRQCCQARLLVRAAGPSRCSPATTTSSSSRSCSARRRAHRLRGDDDPRAGRDDRRRAGRPASTSAGPRPAGAAGRRRGVRGPGGELPGAAQGVSAHPRRARVWHTSAGRSCRSTTTNGRSWRRVLAEVGLMPGTPPPPSPALAAILTTRVGRRSHGQRSQDILIIGAGAVRRHRGPPSGRGRVLRRVPGAGRVARSRGLSGRQARLGAEGPQGLGDRPNIQDSRGLPDRRGRHPGLAAHVQRGRWLHDHLRGGWPRALPSDFRVRSLDGIADDWPIDYFELLPFF